jgi:hypothetical protein
MSITALIKAQCDFCINRQKGERRIKCHSAACKLNDLSVTPLKRIKAFCLECVPEGNLKAVKECSGRLLNGCSCSLHFFRLGKNPNRAVTGGKNLPSKPLLNEQIRG